MKDKIRIAFDGINRGYSADRVVADPLLNEQFIRRCLELGIEKPPFDLNLQLLNLRKAGLLRGRARSKRTSFRDEDSYRFASEIAARFIEKRDGVTLDRIICDPGTAAGFDGVAAEIAPGYQPLQYRWAALNLRKSRSLRPELISHVVRPIHVSFASVDGLNESAISNQQGIYIFYSSSETLYVGEGGNLRNRIAKHLEHSDNKNLARWFWSNGFRDVHLEMQILDANTSTKVRRALEAELISTRGPIFNVQRLAVS